MADAAHAARLWKPLSPPPKLAAENFRPRWPNRPHESPVSGGLPKSDPPQTPRIRANPAHCDRRRLIVSTTADSMAVGGVECELVSAGRSLICRENTGNFVRFEHRGGRLGRASSADPVGLKQIPYGGKQGIFSSEQGTPGAEQGIDTPCFRTACELRRLGHRFVNAQEWRHGPATTPMPRRDAGRTNINNARANRRPQSPEDRPAHDPNSRRDEPLRACRM